MKGSFRVSRSAEVVVACPAVQGGVLGNPDARHHANIRAFMEHGVVCIQLEKSSQAPRWQ